MTNMILTDEQREAIEVAGEHLGRLSWFEERIIQILQARCERDGKLAYLLGFRESPVLQRIAQKLEVEIAARRKSNARIDPEITRQGLAQAMQILAGTQRRVG